jgi:hypothetical protein
MAKNKYIKGRIKKMGAQGFYGFLVAVLSILVSVLLGYQFYTVIHINQIIDSKVDKAISEMDCKILQVLDGTLFVVSMENASVYMQPETYLPNIAIQYLGNAIGHTDNIKKVNLDRFIQDSNSILDNFFSEIEESNLNWFIDRLREKSTLDIRITDLLLRIEQLRNQTNPLSKTFPP